MEFLCKFNIKYILSFFQMLVLFDMLKYTGALSRRQRDFKHFRNHMFSKFRVHLATDRCHIQFPPIIPHLDETNFGLFPRVLFSINNITTKHYLRYLLQVYLNLKYHYFPFWFQILCKNVHLFQIIFLLHVPVHLQI